MNHAAAHASMITCAQGLGRLLPGACARRWRIANDIEPGDAGLAAHICKPCPDGKVRSELVQLKPRPKTATGRLNGAADRDCKSCGVVYKPTNRKQLFCKRPKCRKARATQYDRKRRVEKPSRMQQCAHTSPY